MKIGVGRNNTRIILALTSLLWVIVGCGHRSKPLELYGLRGHTMGTTYSIKIVQERGRAVDVNALKAEIDELFKQVNLKMSTYLQESELSRLNRAPAGEWFPVSTEMMTVLIEARRVSEKSNGAFDITVGPLVNLWGFGPEMRPTVVPTDSEIAARRALVGYQKLELQESPPAVRKAAAGMYCDLSAIAKGWGVDQAAERLEAKGFRNYMVEIGGEVRAKGVNAKGEAWRIGISSPDPQIAVQRVIRISGQSVATSGDYHNYFEQNGVRYSHTIDPSTARPITHKLASVTVIHPSCMTADAFATAIDVLGPDDGMRLAEKENLAVFMIVKTEQGFVEQMNRAFEAFLQK
ncbi:MAG: FAD:protein FMN transferase [candidate division KSB1 bacterium]|nr:FAD:protein FMN transferase [candidate division KSB1 bacterium]